MNLLGFPIGVEADSASGASTTLVLVNPQATHYNFIIDVVTGAWSGTYKLQVQLKNGNWTDLTATVTSTGTAITPVFFNGPFRAVRLNVLTSTAGTYSAMINSL